MTAMYNMRIFQEPWQLRRYVDTYCRNLVAASTFCASEGQDGSHGEMQAPLAQEALGVDVSEGFYRISELSGGSYSL